MFANTLLQASTTPPFEGISTGLLIIIIIVALWSLVWKGLALWKSAQKGDKIWFVIMLVVNTLGILEIIYLLTHREPKDPTSVQ